MTLCAKRSARQHMTISVASPSCPFSELAVTGLIHGLFGILSDPSGMWEKTTDPVAYTALEEVVILLGVGWPIWTEAQKPFLPLGACRGGRALQKGVFLPSIRADFREGDEDSNFSLFRIRRFTEWPGPLH